MFLYRSPKLTPKLAPLLRVTFGVTSVSKTPFSDAAIHSLASKFKNWGRQYQIGAHLGLCSSLYTFTMKSDRLGRMFHGGFQNIRLTKNLQICQTKKCFSFLDE